MNILAQNHKNVQAKHPLIHNITNYVTVNDCANILLASGASPIMADDLSEVVEITSICHALVINIGTLNQRTIQSMVAAGEKAKALGHHVILDPVGAGASTLRTETAQMLMDKVKPTVIRGNISEIKTLYNGAGQTQGVDANEVDTITDDNLEEAIIMIQAMARKFDCVVAITGAIDLVADASHVFIIKNGHPSMSKITGTGCMLTALIGAFVASNNNPLEATAAAVCMMGIAGEKAHQHITANGLGTSSLRTFLIDTISTFNLDDFEREGNYDYR